MPRVNNRDFVVAWATATTVKDVVKATGMTAGTCSKRAQYLREKGVKLPKLLRVSGGVLDQLEIAQLNSLIKKHDIGERR